MKSQSELAKDFERGADDGKASHMFIENDLLFSYGHHYPIAYRMRNGYLFTEENSSQSTECQKTKVKRELSGEIIYTDSETIKEANRHDANSIEELRELQVIETL